MNGRQLLLLFLAVALLAVVPAGAAQEPLLVGFVVDSALRSAALVDMGPSGLSTLGTIFRSLGAQVQSVDLSQPVPEAIDLLVLIKPLEPLTLSHVARLWHFTRQGKNILLAVDPENYYLGFTNVDLNLMSNGFSDLVGSDYGILIDESMLIEPDFNQETIVQLETSLSRVQTDVVSSPVTLPLSQYGLSVAIWGSRSLQVEPFGVDSFAVPLLVTDTAYAEVDPRVFRRAQGRVYRAPEVPLELNIGQDRLGRLNVAALAENTAVGSRIAIFGDSEIFQNGFGLAASGNTAQFPGNRVMVERLAAWLLDLPASQWPSLPAGFTWLLVDGLANDWEVDSALVVGDDTPHFDAAFDIEQVRVFRDDQYTYLLIETAARPDAGVTVTLEGAGPEQRLTATTEGLAVSEDQNAQLGLGGKMAVGSVIELRLPRRLISDSLGELCLSPPDGNTPVCLTINATIPVVNTRAPLDRPVLAGMAVTVISAGDANIRTGPDTSYPAIASVPNGTTLTATGRTENLAWIQVESAGFSGWIVEYLLTSSGDFATLPVVDVP